MKRFVICLDGTWQKLSQDDLTNIGIIARSVGHKTKGADGNWVEQVVLYSQGVGANIDALGQTSFLASAQYKFNKLAGGMFGEGLEDGIVDTYLRLAFNYEHGDEIFIFGFSRGAFAARSLVGLINCAGIVSRVHADKAWEAFQLYRERLPDNATEAQRQEQLERQLQFRRLYGKGARTEDGRRLALDEPPKINYLGIFDTVGQRGVPQAFGWLTNLFNRRYGFHNTRICPNVLAARHAVAIDESRLGFPPTLWDGLEDENARLGRKAYEQRWFIGTHGDVGGGVGSLLSAAPLKWVAEGAAAAGLRFYGTYGEDESPLNATLRKAGLDFYQSKINRPRFWKSLSPMNYPISARKIWARKDKPTVQDVQECLDESVLQRMHADIRPRYNPAPLRPFKPAFKSLARSHRDDARR